jgi:hypothetical protein
MSNDIDLENARRVLEYTWSEIAKYGDQTLVALQRAVLNRSVETRARFEQSVRDSMVASENWKNALELAGRPIRKRQVRSPPKRLAKKPAPPPDSAGRRRQRSGGQLAR